MPQKSVSLPNDPPELVLKTVAIPYEWLLIIKNEWYFYWGFLLPFSVLKSNFSTSS